MWKSEFNIFLILFHYLVLIVKKRTLIFGRTKKSMKMFQTKEYLFKNTILNINKKKKKKSLSESF